MNNSTSLKFISNLELTPVNTDEDNIYFNYNATTEDIEKLNDNAIYIFNIKYLAEKNIKVDVFFGEHSLQLSIIADKINKKKFIESSDSINNSKIDIEFDKAIKKVCKDLKENQFYYELQISLSVVKEIPNVSINNIFCPFFNFAATFNEEKIITKFNYAEEKVPPSTTVIYNREFKINFKSPYNNLKISIQNISESLIEINKEIKNLEVNSLNSLNNLFYTICSKNEFSSIFSIRGLGKVVYIEDRDSMKNYASISLHDSFNYIYQNSIFNENIISKETQTLILMNFERLKVTYLEDTINHIGIYYCDEAIIHDCIFNTIDISRVRELMLDNITVLADIQNKDINDNFEENIPNSIRNVEKLSISNSQILYIKGFLITEYSFIKLKTRYFQINSSKYFIKTFYDIWYFHTFTIDNNSINKFILKANQNNNIIKQFACAGLSKIDFDLENRNNLIFILDKTFITLEKNPYKIQLLNNNKTFFIPLNSSILNAFLNNIDDSSYSLYKKFEEKDLLLIFNRKSKINKYFYSLNFIELELRNKKHISCANRYAYVADNIEFDNSEKYNFIDYFWGLTYKFGYTEKPTLVFTFFTFFIFLLSFNILNVLNINFFTLDIPTMLKYSLNSIIPTFKSPDLIFNSGWKDFLIILWHFLANTFMASNLVGFGVSLKRRYSRVSS